MSGGIGESMLIGAAVGGGTALVTGNDPLQGALLGGVTGGISGAVGGAGAGAVGGGAAGAGAAGTTAATTQASNMLGTNLANVAVPNAATQAATQGITNIGIQSATPTLANTAIPGIGTPDFASQAVSEVVNAPMQQALQMPDLSAYGGMGPGGIKEFGMANAGDLRQLYNMPEMTNLELNRNISDPSVWANARDTYSRMGDAGGTSMITADDIANAGTDMIPQSAMSAGPEKSMLGRFGDWYGGLGTGEKIGYGIAGGVALQGLMQGLNPPQVELEKEEENPFGLATYDRKAFTPYVAQPNVYRPSYANGGIASLPLNRNYPQAMQQNTEYATSPQMPTSAEVLQADYDTLTNPYSGEPVGMAEGGSLRDAVARYMGGNTGSNNAISTPTRTTPKSTPVVDPSVIESRRLAAERAEQLAQQRALMSRGSPFMGMGSPFMGSSFMGGMSNSPFGWQTRLPQRPSEPQNFIASNFTPTVSRGPNTNIYRPSFARGGIAGNGDLGDYADGGMPRLLRGPGDGVSDDIPASIAGKQPARLADGEFVIPARIVSEIGNGSTDAGAKRLYAMMDRVQNKRKKSVGKNKVAVDSKAYKELAKV